MNDFQFVHFSFAQLKRKKCIMTNVWKITVSKDKLNISSSRHQFDPYWYWRNGKKKKTRRRKKLMKTIMLNIKIIFTTFHQNKIISKFLWQSIKTVSPHDEEEIYVRQSKRSQSWISRIKERLRCVFFIIIIVKVVLFAPLPMHTHTPNDRIREI